MFTSVSQQRKLRNTTTAARLLEIFWTSYISVYAAVQPIFYHKRCHIQIKIINKGQGQHQIGLGCNSRRRNIDCRRYMRRIKGKHEDTNQPQLRPSLKQSLPLMTRSLHSEKMARASQYQPCICFYFPIRNNLETLKPFIPQELLTLSEAQTLEVSDELMTFCFNMPQQKLSNKDRQNPHGKAVVEAIMIECEQDTKRLGDFIKLWKIFINSLVLTIEYFVQLWKNISKWGYNYILWRSNFLESMQPKFLPLGWRVDHTIERSFGKDSVFNKNASDEGSSESPETQKIILCLQDTWWGR